MGPRSSFPQSLQVNISVLIGRHLPFLTILFEFLRPFQMLLNDSLFRFVNFIQRQMFVLRTHRSRTERWVNLFLMWLTATTSATLGFNMLVSDI